MDTPAHALSSRLALSARGLRRSFGAVRALDGVDLEVPRGAFFALLGTNGAGKTTAVRVFSGLLRADGGEAEVLGFSLRPRPPRALAAQIGLVPDQPPLFAPLSVRENARHLAGLRGLPRALADGRIAELAAGLGIEAQLDVAAGTLSHGSAKKAALMVAMLHAPALLFLDEPFEGIDPPSARAIRTLLASLCARGATVFMTSHVLPVVASVATHVAVLHAGRVRAAGSLDEVSRGHASLEDAVLAQLGDARSAPELAWYRPS